MRKKRFSEVEIIKVLKAYESGVPVATLSCQHGIAESTIYAWQSRYGGMSVSELKCLKHLQEENRRLKQMYATLSMDHELLKELLEKKYGVDLSDASCQAPQNAPV